MSKVISAGTAALLFLGGTLPGVSAVLLSEPFDYADGPLVSVSAGTWVHHSGTTAEVTVVSGRAFISQTNTEDVSTLLAGQPYPPSSNAFLYAGFTVNFSALPSGSGDYFAHFKSAGTGGFNDKLFATTSGAGAGGFRLGVANGANTPAAVLATDLNLNTDYRVVTRYSVKTAVSTLWLSPGAESDPGVTATDVASQTNTITAFALRESGSGGTGMGSLSLDNLSVGTAFADVVTNNSPPTAPVFTLLPQSLVVTSGFSVTLQAAATGTTPLNYQWQLYGTNLPGASDPSLLLTGATTQQAGPYSIVVSNSVGWTSSPPAVLTVVPAPDPGPAASLSMLLYNVKGNGATTWSTNSDQVRAIGREVMYLQPDIIAFNEIPNNFVWEMTNFITAFLPGYYLASNSVGDGFIRNVVASRFPIRFSKSYLHASSLAPFGYSGSGFTRDLFQAQIAVPNFPQPLDVFVAHLKATTSDPPGNADKRAAEASAVSNFFATVFLPGTNTLHPYLLAGDMNEDIFRPETNRYTSGQPIQRMTSPPTGLFLTTPVNPVTQKDLTESIQSSLDVRFDYILPCAVLYSNIVSAEVFRTDLLNNPPAPLLASDDKTASDHLPVLMRLNNPYTQPFRVTSLVRSNQTTTVQWESVRGQQYRIDGSADLEAWAAFSPGLTATGAFTGFATNSAEAVNFFRVQRLLNQ